MIKHKVLITGGGGFIGTQVAWELASYGHDVTIVDRNPPIHNFPGIYKVSDYLDFFTKNETHYDTVIHLAAEHLVEQSVTTPAEYYTNNVIKMKAMLDLMVAQRIKNIIFSSSGNVYGRQGGIGFPLKEDIYYDPENPYASTKVAGEMLIRDYSKAYGINYVTLRYFNASGADPDCRFGYIQRPATHVVPLLCNKAITGKVFQIFGTDYHTDDGTCVRDYVHVADLAKAHVEAIEFLNDGNKNETFNIGGGSNGISVMDLIEIIGDISGGEPDIEHAPRRQGDPTILVADITKAQKMLNWEPVYTIYDIVRHAWNWEKKFETS